MTEENEKPDENEQRRASERSSEGPPPAKIDDRVRAILSGIVLIGFVFTLVVVIFLQYFAQMQIRELGSLEGVPTVESVGSIYAGVTGAILGYYFGKSQ
jgi:hypothetical protein